MAERERVGWPIHGTAAKDRTRWSYRNGGPVTVDLSITLAPTEGGTRLVSRFDARPNGFFRVIFPIFLQMMKRAEKSNMTNARRALESTQPVG